ncbi:MAG: hypothetical protein SFY32_02765 [Bacteroidota bacterium]|nr:hypothetical protein [Bacteroidota bacterium]
MDYKVIFWTFAITAYYLFRFWQNQQKAKAEKAQRELINSNPTRSLSSQESFEEIKDNESDEKQIIRQFYHEPEAKIEYVSIDTTVDPYASIVEGQSLLTDDDKIQVIELKSSKSSKLAKEIRNDFKNKSTTGKAVIYSEILQSKF